MRKYILIFSLLATTCLADLNPNIDPSNPASYKQQQITNTKISGWIVKSVSNDIAFAISDYPMNFLIPGTDKTAQTAFLMAAQTGANISFYVENVEASQWWPTGWFGRINNFAVHF